MDDDGDGHGELGSGAGSVCETAARILPLVNMGKGSLSSHSRFQQVTCDQGRHLV